MKPPPAVPPPLPQKKNRLWSAYLTASSIVDYVFVFFSPIPFALPLGVAFAYLGLQLFGIEEGWIALFVFGYAAGGVAQLALRWLVGRLVTRR